MLTPLPDVHGLVSELLLGMRLSDVQYRRIRVTRPFGLNSDKTPGRVRLHFVGRGPVLLRGVPGATMRLEAGDAILLPQDTPHVLLPDPDTPCREIVGSESAKICDTVASAGVGAEAAPNDALIFSTYMELDLGGMQPLVGAIPEFMHVDTLLMRYSEIRLTLDAMERESCSGRAGFADILVRLADVIVAFIVHGRVKCGCGNATDWMQTLHESKLGPAIATLYRDPGRNRSVAELTVQAGVSRSVFAERFLATARMTPVRYLTELRMWPIAQRITRDHGAIGIVAYRFGYGSLAAFSRAFKRMVGRSPGAMRAEGAGADA